MRPMGSEAVSAATGSGFRPSGLNEAARGEGPPGPTTRSSWVAVRLRPRLSPTSGPSGQEIDRNRGPGFWDPPRNPLGRRLVSARARSKSGLRLRAGCGARQALRSPPRGPRVSISASVDIGSGPGPRIRKSCGDEDGLSGSSSGSSGRRCGLGLTNVRFRASGFGQVRSDRHAGHRFRPVVRRCWKRPRTSRAGRRAGRLGSTRLRPRRTRSVPPGSRKGSCRRSRTAGAKGPNKARPRSCRVQPDAQDPAKGRR